MKLSKVFFALLVISLLYTSMIYAAPQNPVVDNSVQVQVLGMSYSVGERVEVLWKGSWYKAHIIEVGHRGYKVHYDGYSARWDEWVGTHRIRKIHHRGQWSVGDRVMVLWKGSWYRAHIIEVGRRGYKVHYDGYSSRWDEWVDSSRIRPR